MKVCAACGEVYADGASQCAAHSGELLPWAEATGLHSGVHTAVDHDVTAVDTPFDVTIYAPRSDAGAIPATFAPTARGVVGAVRALPRTSPASVARRGGPDDSWVLGGRYRLTEPLGVGGYGAVFAARDELSGDLVAIKILSPVASRERALLKRFYREAIAASRAAHPHIVALVHVGGDSDVHYIVMEHLDGGDLSRALRVDPVFSPARALTIAAQCAAGLGAAHRAGILHRDLKPANVFLIDRDGRPDYVKIIDFGICKLTRLAGDYSDLTSASKVLGTPFYMAPEQARGSDLDGRCDIYGLGVLLFEMLTGTRPFTGRSTIEILTSHMEAPRVPPSSLRPELAAIPGLDALVLGALAVDRSRRWATMDVFYEQILACLSQVGCPLEPTPAVRRTAGARARATTVRLARRRWPWAAAIAVLAAVLWWTWPASGAREGGATGAGAGVPAAAVTVPSPETRSAVVPLDAVEAQADAPSPIDIERPAADAPLERTESIRERTVPVTSPAEPVARPRTRRGVRPEAGAADEHQAGAALGIEEW